SFRHPFLRRPWLDALPRRPHSLLLPLPRIQCRGIRCIRRDRQNPPCRRRCVRTTGSSHRTSCRPPDFGPGHSPLRAEQHSTSFATARIIAVADLLSTCSMMKTRIRTLSLRLLLLFGGCCFSFG